MVRLLVVACLVAFAAAKPAKQEMSLARRIENAFTKYLIMETRDVIYPDGFNEGICNGNTDCCHPNPCVNGECHGKDNPSGEDVISKFGYTCDDPNLCGIKPGMFAGVYCNVPAETACDVCRGKHGKVDFCYATRQTIYGYVCMALNKDGNYKALDRRELDVLYGEGTSQKLEQIADEEAKKMKEEKKAESNNGLESLLRNLLEDLE